MTKIVRITTLICMSSVWGQLHIKQGCSRSFFLCFFVPWRPTTLLKRNYNTDVFLWNLRNLWEDLFLQTTSGGCVCRYRCWLEIRIFFSSNRKWPSLVKTLLRWNLRPIIFIENENHSKIIVMPAHCGSL